MSKYMDCCIHFYYHINIIIFVLRANGVISFTFRPTKKKNIFDIFYLCINYNHFVQTKYTFSTMHSFNMPM